MLSCGACACSVFPKTAAQGLGPCVSWEEVLPSQPFQEAWTLAGGNRPEVAATGPSWRFSEVPRSPMTELGPRSGWGPQASNTSWGDRASMGSLLSRPVGSPFAIGMQIAHLRGCSPPPSQAASPLPGRSEGAAGHPRTREAGTG